MEDTAQKRDVYAIATDRIIKHLENGTVPWRRPWTDAGLPRNYVTQKPYRGVNVWLLNACGYEHNVFLTFKQAKEAGGTMKKSEKAHPILFWKWIKKDRNDKRPLSELKANDLRPILRYYTVFNIGQCAGLSDGIFAQPAKPNEPLLACEAILDAMPSVPRIVHDVHKACYYPETDTVNMPRMEAFVSSEAYYATLYHELVHSTGHSSRLNRKELALGGFGSEDYSIEELTAEIGACYLSSHTGIVVDDHAGNAAYIQGWLNVLKNDKRFIVYASAQAQRAVEFILNERQEF